VFPEEEVVFEMNGSLSPGVFHPVKDETFLHIIMPVRIQN
jgi:DNA polymerase III sliding clamp (beta) subunit (PCNA family)